MNYKKPANLLRSQLDRKFEVLRRYQNQMPLYTGEWIRMIRQALGMSQVQLAKRLHITPQTLRGIEESELKGSTSILTLKRAARALGCTVYVTFIPEESLETMVKKKAKKVAKTLVERIVHTMALEKQAPSKKYIESQIEELAGDLVRTNNKRIWDEPET